MLSLEFTSKIHCSSPYIYCISVFLNKICLATLNKCHEYIYIYMCVCVCVCVCVCFFLGSPLGLKMSTFTVCSYDLFECVKRKREQVSTLMSVLIRTITPLCQGPTLITSFSINYFFRGFISKYSQTGC